MEENVRKERVRNGGERRGRRRGERIEIVINYFDFLKKKCYIYVSFTIL